MVGKYFVFYLVFIYFIVKCVVLINRFLIGVLFLKKNSFDFGILLSEGDGCVFRGLYGFACNFEIEKE